MPADFVQMNLRVTRSARDAWESYAREHGVTSSALAEAIGEWLAEPNGRTLSAILGRASDVADARRSRKPAGSGQGSGQEPGDDE